MNARDFHCAHCAKLDYVADHIKDPKAEMKRRGWVFSGADDKFITCPQCDELISELKALEALDRTIQ